MDYEVIEEIDAPRARVYAVYRDEIAALRPWLPNVSSFETRSRSEDGPIVKLVNVWGAQGEIPAAVRSFVPKEATSWTDHATWNADAWTCAWRTVPHALADAIRSEGGHRFEELPNGRTRVVSRGVIDVDVKKVPGVPRLLGAAVKPAVETFLVGSVKTNLAAFGKAARSYLASR